MLTVQMLVRNNEKTVTRAIESLPLGVDLVVGDLGCSDSTLDICARYGAEIVPVSLLGDYSKARNSVMRDGVNMYLEPWEFVVSGGDLIPLTKPNASFCVIESGIVTKQLRLWSSARFQNPAFEAVVAPSECEPRVVIGSSDAPDRRKEMLEICRNWSEKKPTSPEPHYYLSFCYLSLGMVSEFISEARRYLVMRDDSDISSVMLKYSLARAEFLSGDMRSASRNILACLCMRPSFAEFWCLLGDMLYKMSHYDRAEAMYRNAMTIGKRRKKTDDGPIDIKKYAEYPSGMVKNIEKIRAGSGFVYEEKMRDR